MSSNLTATILVLGGGAAMIWTGITDPAGGLVGEIGRVLKGKPSQPTGASGWGSSAVAAASALLSQPALGGEAGEPAASLTTAGGQSGVVSVAASEIGVPYVWGGGNESGPTGGGFDCSGLTQYAYYKGAGITIPRVAEAQRAASTQISATQAAAGDLVFFGAPAYHVGIVIGGGQMIHAPHTGTTVKTEAISDVTPGPVRYGRFGGNSGGGIVAA